MSKFFEDFDYDSFWSRSEYSLKEYVGQALTAEDIESVEKELGFKLPASYIEFMKHQNGGIPQKRYFMASGTAWVDNYISVHGILGFDSNKTFSLCGKIGSKLMIDEWEYPAIGIYFADTPSGGHDMLCLDYRKCGPEGEPEVVHVDQECDFSITFVAKDFETFIKSLVTGDFLE